jgi:hypothetical protein
MFYADIQTVWFQDQLQAELWNQYTSNISGLTGSTAEQIKYT